MKLASTLITTLLFSGVASAHNVWLEPESNMGGIQRYVVKFGHEQTEFYPQAKLKRVRYIDEQGQVQDTMFEFNAKQGDKGEAVVGDKGAKIYLTMEFGLNYLVANMLRKRSEKYLMRSFRLTRLN